MKKFVGFFYSKGIFVALGFTITLIFGFVLFFLEKRFIIDEQSRVFVIEFVITVSSLPLVIWCTFFFATSSVLLMNQPEQRKLWFLSIILSMILAFASTFLVYRVIATFEYLPTLL